MEEYDNHNYDEEKEKIYVVENISDFNNDKNLGFDKQDIDYYEDIFSNLGRNPTNIELYDLSQCNSEHARHWFFNGRFTINNSEINKSSLIQLLKTTQNNNTNSLVSFKDNASVIKGNSVISHNLKNKCVSPEYDQIHYSYKAETHNFPTGISPFLGAATGVGGRMRDNTCVGLGGNLIAGTAGYCVGDINQEYENQLNSPRKILIEASNTMITVIK